MTNGAQYLIDAFGFEHFTVSWSFVFVVARSSS
jgi:hypothetical protein